MAKHQVPSDTDSGSHEELSRRTFLANATLAIGGVIGLVLVVPTVGSLVPESLLRGSAASAVGGTWADVPETPLGEADAKPGKPIKVSFDFDAADGYFPSSSRTESVWAVKMNDAQAHAFKDKRPDLFENAAQTLKYPALVMNFVLFSPICTHLGCRFDWQPDVSRFVCGCHGSQFDGTYGTKLAGPAPRGLDPLPMREQNGRAQVTWIQYRSGTPDRLIVSFT